MVQGRKPGGQRPGGQRRPTRARTNPPRSPARPNAARRTGAGGAARRTVAPQPRRLTGRAIVLVALLLGLLLAYAYPLRIYLTQQAEIARLEREQADQAERIADLRVQREKWDDPAFIEAQARKRFMLVRPGDRTYVIVWDDREAARVSGGDQGAPAPEDETAWYARLWSSVAAANERSER
jgi:cell division protein FtsB